MNATRAATIRLRSSFDGAVSLGRVQTPTLAILTRREEEIRAFVPEKYWLVDAQFEADGDRRYEGRFHAGAQPRLDERRGGRRRSSRPSRGGRGEITKLDKTKRKERAPLLYDLTSLQREANTRFGFSRAPHARRRAALLRGAQGADLSAHELALPDERHGPRDQADRRRTSAARARVRARPPRYVAGARPAAARPRRRRRQGRRPPRDHPDQLRRTRSRRWATTTAASTTWSRGASSPSSIPRPSSRTRASRRRSPSTSSARAARCCVVPGLARRLRRAGRGRAQRRRRGRGPRPAAAQARAGRGRRHARGRGRWRRRPSRRGATPTPRCSARWRPPASSSTTRSCARR